MKNIYYLDNLNNIVPQSEATKVVIREVDDNGKIISEVFGSITPPVSRNVNVDESNLSPEARLFVEQFVKGHREAMEAKRK